jgi:hypothetical protein
MKPCIKNSHRDRAWVGGGGGRQACSFKIFLEIGGPRGDGEGGYENRYFEINFKKPYTVQTKQGNFSKL